MFIISFFVKTVADVASFQKCSTGPSFSADFHFLTNLSSPSENSLGFPNFRQKRNGFHLGTFHSNEKKKQNKTKQNIPLLPWNRTRAQFFSSKIPEALFLLDSRGFNGSFYTKDALSVWTNLGKCFIVRLGYASLV